MSKAGQILRKLYFITWIRIPVKFVICFTGIKIGWDYSQYLTKWRRKNTQPRFCEYDAQSPASPPLTQPYQWYSNYEQMQELKHFYSSCNKSLKLYMGIADRSYVYTDHPYRQNVNAIDQLLMRAKEYSCSQNLKFYTINQYVTNNLNQIKQEESIPQGVYKQIRQIHQPQVEINSPIIPRL